MADASHQTELTDTKMALGTPGFMAPEQMRSARQSDGRVDIWALGVILYKLTTGVMPFDGSNMNQVAFRVLSAEPAAKPSTHNPALPPSLDEAVCRCLEKDREKRFQSVTELAACLRRLAESVPAMLGAADDGSEAMTLDLTTRVRHAPIPAGSHCPPAVPAPRPPAPAKSATPAHDAAPPPITYITPFEQELEADAQDDAPTQRLPRRR
ncbi:protein kinase [Polyangium jinanense]|uniref:protein kinase domain-containing protein n=1 Tax=Polyangium jinanense TaxID=2829994 RepID=UPI0023415ECD|nr:protein kinase [Polyangium jinanense]MDC3958534.1 protein kinase [Polyangium jinanense]